MDNTVVSVEPNLISTKFQWKIKHYSLCYETLQSPMFTLKDNNNFSTFWSISADTKSKWTSNHKILSRIYLNLCSCNIRWCYAKCTIEIQNIDQINIKTIQCDFKKQDSRSPALRGFFIVPIDLELDTIVINCTIVIQRGFAVYKEQLLKPLFELNVRQFQNDFRKLLCEQSFCDFIIVCEGMEFKVHKVI